GYDEPWLRESADEAIRGVLDATRPHNPLLEGITLERLRSEAAVPLRFPPGAEVPFADGRFPTPSGKVELRCEAMRAHGLDSLPDYTPPAEFEQMMNEERRTMNEESSSFIAHRSSLMLISGASHHYVSSSMANVPSLMAKEGAPFVEINPAD